MLDEDDSIPQPPPIPDILEQRRAFLPAFPAPPPHSASAPSQTSSPNNFTFSQHNQFGVPLLNDPQQQQQQQQQQFAASNYFLLSLNERRELKDQLGFPVEQEERTRYTKHAADFIERDKALKQQWDSLIRQSNWDPTSWPSRSSLLQNEQFRFLVFKGIPSVYRLNLWMVLSGALELKQRETPNYYEGLLRAAVSDLSKLPAAEEIERDLNRTFPGHAKFSLRDSHNGINPLRRILLAYSIRNKHVGYCQSMNTLGGWLYLIAGTEEEAFWLLCSIAEIACPKYYTRNMTGCQTDMKIFTDLLDECCPQLTSHFESASISLPLAITKWFLCIFIGSLPTDTTLRIWDAFFLHGSLILFRTAIAILKMLEPRFMATGSTQDLIALLQEGPKTLHDHRELFKKIRSLTEISHYKISSLHKKYSQEVKQEVQRHHKSKDVNALLRITSFSKDELSRLWNKFTSKKDVNQTSSGEPALNFTQFQEVFFTAIPRWHPDVQTLKQLFRMFDRDGDGLLDFKEWVCGLSMVCCSSLDEKLTILFHAHDSDHDGYISKDELISLLESTYLAINPIRPHIVTDVVDLMFKELGVVGNALLSLDDFKQASQLEPLISEYLSFGMLGEFSEGINTEEKSTPPLASYSPNTFGADTTMPQNIITPATTTATSSTRGRNNRMSMVKRISRLFSIEELAGSASEESLESDDEDEDVFATRFARIPDQKEPRVFFSPEEQAEGHATPVDSSTNTRETKSRPVSAYGTLMQPLLSGVDIADESISASKTAAGVDIGSQDPQILVHPKAQRISWFEVDSGHGQSSISSAPEPNYTSWKTAQSRCRFFCCPCCCQCHCHCCCCTIL